MPQLVKMKSVDINETHLPGRFEVSPTTVKEPTPTPEKVSDVETVFRQAKELYGDNEGQHATPSEIALTLYIEPTLQSKQRKLPKAAPAGPIYDFQDFRRRYPDGRMGSDPFLAKSSHGKILLDKAAIALTEDLSNFLKEL